jgi:hypothetical protein
MMRQNTNFGMIGSDVENSGKEISDADLDYSFCSKGGTYHKNVKTKKDKWYTSEPDLSFFG